MSRPWRNFTSAEEVQLHIPSLGAPGVAGPCPSCGEPTLRWYHYRNPFRQRSKISYIWCRCCRRYYGQTTVEATWDLPDPYEASTSDDRAEMSSDLDTFFSGLDRLWDLGELPQIRPAQPARSSRGKKR